MKQSARDAVGQLHVKYKGLEERNAKPNLSPYARQQFQIECEVQKEKTNNKINVISALGRDARELCLNLAAGLQVAVNWFEADLQCALSRLFVGFEIVIPAEAKISWDASYHVEIKYDSGISYDRKKVRQEVVGNLQRFIQCSYRYIEKNEDVVTLENERITLVKGIDCVPAVVKSIGQDTTRILRAHLEKLYLVSN